MNRACRRPAPHPPQQDDDGHEGPNVMDRTKLIGHYARLIGIRDSLPTQDRATYVDASIGQDYDSVISELDTVLEGSDMTPFKVGSDGLIREEDRVICLLGVLLSRLHQAISFLEKVHFAEEHIIEIGTLYNAITDVELRERCSDLLTAVGMFDRAINQATQVLEERIRTKSGDDSNQTATSLVNAVIKTQIDRTVLKVSDDEGEQEGFAHICRGIMQAFRNPTHHRLSDTFSREDALKFCGFVDNLLRIVDKAEVRRA